MKNGDMDMIDGVPIDDISTDPDDTETRYKDKQIKSGIMHNPDQVSLSWIPGRELLGQYIVEKKLGEGGMGAVYLVRRLSDQSYFAVKTRLNTEFNQSGRKRMFLKELRTWIGLPQHPNITACHFFRTVEDRLVIFSEYIEGGTLSEWIRTGRIDSLRKMLDVAIQVARGLSLAHSRGVIHQDIKPSNILMGHDGVAKITDFGLAGGRHFGDSEGDTGETSGSPLISAGGMTVAYCSPEQAGREKIRHWTDMWSWAVTVLEMWVGQVTWSAGYVADMILESYLEKGSDSFCSILPAGFAEVLQRSLKSEPQDRWPDMNHIIEELVQVYRENFKEDYPRVAPVVTGTGDDLKQEHDRRMITGAVWDDPKGWLLKAFKASGRDPAGTKKFTSKRHGSQKEQALADLEAYEEVDAILSELVLNGREDLKQDKAKVLGFRAMLLDYLDDIPGSLNLYDQAITMTKDFEPEENEIESRRNLAKLTLRKANALAKAATYREAEKGYDQIIVILEGTPDIETEPESAALLAMAYSNKALMQMYIQTIPETLETYDKAIAIMSRLVWEEGFHNKSKHLAVFMMNKALALRELDQGRLAVEFFNLAARILEPLVYEEGRKEFLFELGRIYFNKGLTLLDLNDFRQADDVLSRSVDILEQLVERENRKDLRELLSLGYLNKAVVLNCLGSHEAMQPIATKAIDILECLVIREGRSELEYELARVYVSKGDGLASLNRFDAALELYTKALAIMERLIDSGGRRELLPSLAEYRFHEAIALDGLKRFTDAIDSIDTAIRILEDLIEEDQRSELEGALLQKFHCRAIFLMHMGKYEQAQHLFDRIIESWTEMITLKPRSEIECDLAITRAYKSECMHLAGNHVDAANLANEIIPYLRKQYEQTGWSYLGTVVKMLEKQENV
jgi:serine/threonine protein kinase